jgi:hypothetical protein
LDQKDLYLLVSRRFCVDILTIFHKMGYVKNVCHIPQLFEPVKCFASSSCIMQTTKQVEAHVNLTGRFLTRQIRIRTWRATNIRQLTWLHEPQQLNEAGEYLVNTFDHNYSLFHSLQKLYLYCILNHKEVNYQNDVTQGGSYKLIDRHG